MHKSPPPAQSQDALVCHYLHGDVLRRRTVGDVVLHGRLDIPAPAPRLVADWGRDVSARLQLEPGEVQALSLARARTRWPDYGRCVAAVAAWAQALGLPDLARTCDVALMACRGASYHHDGALYGGMAFCNLFLGEDRGQDLHFAHQGLRIPLVRGTVVLFDTCQPHAVIARQRSGFDATDFPAGSDCTQVFLTWEVPLDHARVRQLLRMGPDQDTRAQEGYIAWRGAPARVCPHTGRWLA